MLFKLIIVTFIYKLCIVYHMGKADEFKMARTITIRLKYVNKIAETGKSFSDFFDELLAVHFKKELK